MEINDMPKFAGLMHELGRHYGKEISEACSELYWNTWKQFKWVEVEKAVMKYMSDPDERKLMPSPGDIIRWIVGSSETRALQAWAKVTDAISRVGSYESVIFDDLIIHSVISALGGWVKLCLSKTDDLPFIAQDFKKHYIALLKNPPDELPSHLLGRMLSDRPMLVGDKKLSYAENKNTLLLDMLDTTLKKLEVTHEK